MFILAPLLLIFASLLGIAIIIWRKKSYLNKIYALNMAGNGDKTVSNVFTFSWISYGGEFFPEIKSLLEKIKIHEYKTMWLMEAEKFLRKTRLVFMRVDRLSDSLIKKIRRVHVNSQLNGHINKEITVDKKEEFDSVSVPKQTISPAFLKNEESRLIMEIAKNPKDSQLYEALGDLYMEMENWTDAKESYEASIELNPQNELLKQKLSSALEKLAQN